MENFTKNSHTPKSELIILNTFLPNRCYIQNSQLRLVKVQHPKDSLTNPPAWTPSGTILYSFCTAEEELPKFSLLKEKTSPVLILRKELLVYYR